MLDLPEEENLDRADPAIISTAPMGNSDDENAALRQPGSPTCLKSLPAADDDGEDEQQKDTSDRKSDDDCTQTLLQRLCQAFGAKEDTDGLSLEAAREWSLVSGYRGSVSEGLSATGLTEWYTGHEREMQRHYELRLWHNHCNKALTPSPPTPRFPKKAQENPIISFLKRHSIVNSIFFRPPRPNYGPGYKNLVFLPLEHAGMSLPALWLPLDNARGVMIFAHGNACDIAQSPVVSSYRTAFDMSVLALEWPGYGLAPGEPSEENLVESLFDTVLFVHKHLMVPINRIVLYGRSLATGPCTVVASLLEKQGISFQLGGLILKSPYLSWCSILEDFGEEGTIVRRVASIGATLVFDRFPVHEAIKHVTCPTMFIHGKVDDVIPYTHSTRLYALSGAAPNIKSLHIVDHGCHDHGIEIWTEMKEFVSSLNMQREPFPQALPVVCYDSVGVESEKTRKYRFRRRILRKLKWGIVASFGAASAVWGAILIGSERGCSAGLQGWLLLHGITVAFAAVVYATADWVQDDLSRGQNPVIQTRAAIAVGVLFLLWLTDLILGHFSLWHDYNTVFCSSLHWWGAFIAMAAVNYVFILQAILTNK